MCSNTKDHVKHLDIQAFYMIRDNLSRDIYFTFADPVVDCVFAETGEVNVAPE